MERQERVYDVILGVAVLVAMLLLAELAVRELMPPMDLMALTGRTMSQGPIDRWADEDAFCAYQPKPGIHAMGKTVNTHGHISTPEVDFEKPDSTVRILFLGGSSTAGTGFNIPDSITWPWQTAQRLKARGHRIDFINGAAGGYTTFESYGRLWSRLRFFNPDIVVLNHGWNDSYYINRLDEWPTLWRSNDKGGTGYHYLEYMQDVAPLAIDPFIAWSQLFTRLRLAVKQQTGRGVIISDEERNQPIDTIFDPKVLHIYADNLRLIRNFCDDNGMALFLIKQPTLLTRNHLDISSFHWSGHTLSAESLLDVLEAFHAMADTIVKPNRVIDLRSLSGNVEMFADQVHPTFKGCSAFANIVSSHLVNHWPERLPATKLREP